MSLFDTRTEIERGRDHAAKAKNLVENYGDQEGAIVEYEHAVVLLHGPELRLARLELAILYASTEKYQEAQSLFKDAGSLFWADICLILLSFEISRDPPSLAMHTVDGCLLQKIFNVRNHDRFVDFVKNLELRNLTDWQTTLLLRIKNWFLENMHRRPTTEAKMNEPTNAVRSE